MTPTTTPAEFPVLTGREPGTGEWIEVTQERVTIHVDVERAKKASTFGPPIGHGHLSEGGAEPVCIAEPVFLFLA